MKFARVGDVGAERPVAIVGEKTFDLRSLTVDVDGAFLDADGIARARRAIESGDLPSISIDGLRVGAPIARPSAIICVGMNYAAHAAESGSEPPTVPIIFLKTPNTVVGPYDDVDIPRGSSKTDWEVELGIVIGRRTSYLSSREEASDAVAGFVAVNDVSERDFQLVDSGGQWSKGKSCAGFSPVGPWLVPAEEIDHSRVRLRSWVNAQPRQDSRTSDMIFDVEEIVLHLSQYLVLEPGDLILTGTPEGVALSGRFPYLADGDIVEIEIDSLGRQRTVFRDRA